MRINPGNIGSEKKVAAVVEKAAEKKASIRIGVNAGSLEKELLAKYKSATPAAMVQSAMGHVALMEKWGFTDFKLSIKASDVGRTVAAYRMLAKETDHPLHVGVTEAGGLFSGIVKSALGIGMILAEGIGDTIRVSLTRDPVEEVRVGFEILKALGLRKRGVDIISCPTCGRCNIDLFSVARQVEEALIYEPAPLKVAIMGCVVNGPGEAKEADVGIAGCKEFGILFKKGEPVKKVPPGKNGSNPFGGNPSTQKGYLNPAGKALLPAGVRIRRKTGKEKNDKTAANRHHADKKGRLPGMVPAGGQGLGSGGKIACPGMHGHQAVGVRLVGEHRCGPG